MRLEYTELQELWLRRAEIQSVLENDLYAATKEEAYEIGIETEAGLLTELSFIEDQLEGKTMDDIWRRYKGNKYCVA